MKPELGQAILKDGLFATVHRMQCQKRAAMPQPSTFSRRPRRMSDGPIQGLNLPPVVPESILKPLSMEPVPLEGEVLAPVPALVAGEDIPNDLEDESELDNQDDGYAEAHEE